MNKTDFEMLFEHVLFNLQSLHSSHQVLPHNSIYHLLLDETQLKAVASNPRTVAVINTADT